MIAIFYILNALLFQFSCIFFIELKDIGVDLTILLQIIVLISFLKVKKVSWFNILGLLTPLISFCILFPIYQQEELNYLYWLSLIITLSNFIYEKKEIKELKLLNE